MNDLLSIAIKAHGGMDRWNKVTSVAERLMAGRMGATRENIDASHPAVTSKPAETAAFLLAALQ